MSRLLFQGGGHDVEPRRRRPRDRILRHPIYERYVLDEVLPFFDSVDETPCRVAHGCGFGACHAVGPAFRHPPRFDRVVAFSGRLDIKLVVGEKDLGLDDNRRLSEAPWGAMWRPVRRPLGIGQADGLK